MMNCRWWGVRGEGKSGRTRERLLSPSPSQDAHGGRRWGGRGRRGGGREGGREEGAYQQRPPAQYRRLRQAQRPGVCVPKLLGRHAEQDWREGGRKGGREGQREGGRRVRVPDGVRDRQRKGRKQM
jgi:hypothetical protein